MISKREGITGWVEPEVRNRFKGLDLIDTVPDELCNEVCDIDAGDRDQDHPQAHSRHCINICLLNI